MFTFVVMLCLCASASAQTKWVVLKNGQTIEGNVALADGRYAVSTQNGSRIVIGKDRVNFVADSIEDIYWEKWSRVNPEDASSHMSLFRWCLKNNLLEEAQKQIELVAKIENMDDQVGNLSRMAQELELVVVRIEKEAQLAERKEVESLNIRTLPALPGNSKSQFAAAPTIPSTPINAEGRPIRTLQPMQIQSIENDSQIKLVDFEEEMLPTTKVEAKQASDKRTKPAWISNRQLDRETRGMPGGTVSFYKRHIESKLISNCIQCHDSRSAEMPLSKRSFGQTIPRRMSQQNLHFVMEQVDRSDPLSSKLLSMAVTAHGKQEAASFKPNEPFLFDLKKWTVAVSEDPAKWLMTLAESSRQSPAAPTAATPPARESFGPAPARLSAAAAIEDANQIANEIIEVDPKPVGDVDPYDPAAFNRK